MNDKKELEPSGSTSNAELEPFCERLKIVMGTDKIRPFAQKVGVSEGTVRNLLRGGNPRLDNLIQISRATNTNIDWLATGEGPMRHVDGYNEKKASKNKYFVDKLIESSEDNVSSILDEYIFGEMIESAVEIAEDVLEESGFKLPSDKKARYIRAAINLYRKLPKEQQSDMPAMLESLLKVLIN